MLKRPIFKSLVLIILSINAYAQPNNTPNTKSGESSSQANDAVLSLDDCLRFALTNQPLIKQSLIDEAIARTNNGIAYSSWMPQIYGAANFQHYFQLPVAYSNSTSTFVNSGVYNYSNPTLSATQTIFTPDVLLAVKAAKLNILGARQNTAGTKIALMSAVSKAFYDLLLSIEQVNVYKEDTARLKKNLSDAYNRYVSGIVDQVDYKQATITLNNSLSRLKTATETIQAKYAYLRQLIGYPDNRQFSVRFDTAQMMQQIYLDTNAHLQFEKRIEYQQLQTAKRIQRETTLYYQLGFLPSLSAFYTYDHQFENNKFSDLYNHAYPYSYFGLQLNIPIFNGFRRMENVHKAKLLEERTDWDEVNLKLAILTQYSQALASYKSNLFYLRTQGSNVQMAREVYTIVKLQYSEGVKTYLDVVIAESDLQTSEINYLNALFNLLESKIDLERAMGDIPTDI
jgi:outer membrane protein TolC